MNSDCTSPPGVSHLDAPYATLSGSTAAPLPPWKASIAHGLLDSLDDRDFHAPVPALNLSPSCSRIAVNTDGPESTGGLTFVGSCERAACGVGVYLKPICTFHLEAGQVPHDALNVWPARRADGECFHRR